MNRVNGRHGFAGTAVPRTRGDEPNLENRPARTGRNRQTGESLSIQASTAPVFKPSKALKDAVNDGNAA